MLLKLNLYLVLFDVVNSNLLTKCSLGHKYEYFYIFVQFYDTNVKLNYRVKNRCLLKKVHSVFDVLIYVN